MRPKVDHRHLNQRQAGKDDDLAQLHRLGWRDLFGPGCNINHDALEHPTSDHCIHREPHHGTSVVVGGEGATSGHDETEEVAKRITSQVDEQQV